MSFTAHYNLELFGPAHIFYRHCVLGTDLKRPTTSSGQSSVPRPPARELQKARSKSVRHGFARICQLWRVRWPSMERLSALALRRPMKKTMKRLVFHNNEHFAQLISLKKLSNKPITNSVATFRIIPPLQISSSQIPRASRMEHSRSSKGRIPDMSAMKPWIILVKCILLTIQKERPSFKVQRSRLTLPSVLLHITIDSLCCSGGWTTTILMNLLEQAIRYSTRESTRGQSRCNRWFDWATQRSKVYWLIGSWQRLSVDWKFRLAPDTTMHSTWLSTFSRSDSVAIMLIQQMLADQWKSHFAASSRFAFDLYFLLDELGFSLHGLDFMRLTCGIVAICEVSIVWPENWI